MELMTGHDPLLTLLYLLVALAATAFVVVVRRLDRRLRGMVTRMHSLEESVLLSLNGLRSDVKQLADRAFIEEVIDRKLANQPSRGRAPKAPKITAIGAVEAHRDAHVGGNEQGAA